MTRSKAKSTSFGYILTTTFVDRIGGVASQMSYDNAKYAELPSAIDFDLRVV